MTISDTRPRAIRVLSWSAAIVLLTVALAGLGRRLGFGAQIRGDVICYWTAARIIAAGGSPYDTGLQARIQRAAGWDREKHGVGVYDFMPYFYPPWFALLCAPLAAVDYPAAQVAWFVVNVELLLLAGYLLRDAVPGVPRFVPLAMVPTFAFSVAAVLLGQTSPLVLVLVAAAWKLLDAGRDRSGGVALAWLTTKPQLTVLLLPGVLLWAARRGRWGVWWGCGAMLAVLVLASTVLVPGWPAQMLAAPGKVPPPTAFFRGAGASWFVFLEAIGVRGAVLRSAHGIVALACAAAVLRAAADRGRPLRDVLALSLLAAFFVVPYGRYYDFPLLLIPFLVLMGRLAEKPAAVLLLALFVLSYVTYVACVVIRVRSGRTATLRPEFALFWVPLLLTAAWIATARSHQVRDQGGGSGSPLPEVRGESE